MQVADVVSWKAVSGIIPFGVYVQRNMEKKIPNFTMDFFFFLTTVVSSGLVNTCRS